MITIEVTAATDSAGTLQTFYFSTDRFVSMPSDSPANTVFNDCVMDAGSLGLHVFSDGRTGGNTKLETGEITLANSDGSFDFLVDYSFDGRPVIIRSGNIGDAYPSGFSTVFTGTVDNVEATWDKIVIRLRDKQFVFSLPVLTTKYVGTNALPAGIEGTPNDIQGKVKPRVYGTVFNVPPVFINTSLLTYQISDIPVVDIPAVYDRGALLIQGTNYTTSALLQASIPAAGGYNTCFAEGMFQLGSSAAGTITADVVQGATSANRTAAQITKLLVLAAGLSSGEVSSADITALDSANNSVIGIYLDSEETFQEAIDEILNSVGGYSGFDSTGVLRVGVLLTPSGTPVTSLEEYQIFEGIERKQPRDNGIPVYRVDLSHTKIYVVQPSDIAGVVTDDVRAYIATQYRSVSTSDVAVKNQWKLSNFFSTETLLTSAGDATTEAARLLALYKVQRSIYEVPCDLSVFTGNSLKLMDVIRLTVPRYGMNAGKDFRLIGYSLELTTNKVVLSLWG